MKKLILITTTFIFVFISLYSQSEIDLYKLSSRKLTGPARTVGMGGASGTLGDVGSISINPANIGLFNNSELVATFDYRNIKTKTDKFKESKSNFGFDNLSFVTGFNLKSDIASRLNFGFSYNKLKSFAGIIGQIRLTHQAL